MKKLFPFYDRGSQIEVTGCETCPNIGVVEEHPEGVGHTMIHTRGFVQSPETAAETAEMDDPQERICAAALCALCPEEFSITRINRRGERGVSDMIVKR